MNGIINKTKIRRSKMNIKDLGDTIYKTIEKEANITPVGITNRLIASDFLKIFKFAEIDYSVDCVMIERLFPLALCEEQEIETNKYPEEAEKIQKDIFELGSQLVKANNKKQKEILSQIEDLKIAYNSYSPEIVKTKVLTYEPFNDGDKIIVIPFDDKTKEAYKGFCYRMANFAFEYFSTLKMTAFYDINFNVLKVKNTNSIDIICQIK